MVVVTYENKHAGTIPLADSNLLPTPTQIQPGKVSIKLEYVNKSSD